MTTEAYPIPTDSGLIVASSRRQRLRSFAVWANGGRVELELVEESETGKLIYPISLNDGESTSDDLAGGQGVWVNTDLYVKIITGGGFLRGTVFIG